MASTRQRAMRPVLIIDQDATVRALLAEQLGHAGEFAPNEAASMGEAERMVLTSPPAFDAILLDTALPDGDGLAFCARLRQLLEADAEAAQSIRDALPAPRAYVPLPDPVAEVVHGGARRMTHDVAAAAALADARDIMTFRYNSTLVASGDRVPRFVPAPRPDSGGGHP